MMKLFASTLAAGILAATVGSAATIDFADSAFDTTVGTLDPFLDSQTINSTDFDFAVESRGANGYRQSKTTIFFPPPTTVIFNGLAFGVAGNGMSYLEFAANEALTIQSITGFDQSIIDTDTEALTFAISVNGVEVASGHQFDTTTSSWDFSDIDLTAGSVFRISQTGHGDPNSNAVIGSLVYEVAAVPLPAGLPLLLAGLGAFGVMRRRQKA